MKQAIAFTNARVFDGKGATTMGQTLLVENGRIAGVGQGDAPTHARTIDLAGKTIMPGMTVAHWHGEFVDIGPPTFSAGRGGVFLGTEEPPALLALCAAKALNIALMSGVTRVLSGSCSNDLDWQMKVAIERGLIEGPHVTPCSRHVVTTADYEDRGHWWKMPGDFYNGIRRIGGNVFADGVAELAKAVRQEILRGAEIIKVLPTGGHGFELLPAYRGLSRAELETVINTAHERGARVRAHTASKASILECIELGVDIIDHADGIDDECIEAMVKRDVVFVTSMLFTKVVSYGGVGNPVPGKQLDDAWDNMRVMLPRANAAGVKMVPGDDFGGQGMAHELGVYARELLVYTEDMGIGPADVLRWATLNGAKAALADTEHGSVEEGKVADLLVIDGDPIQNIALLTDPIANLKMVMKGGKLIKNELDMS
jgi:imidazolonepropionase-like amidohydrolase